MKRILVIDPDKCVGCGTCALACSSIHFEEFTPGKSGIFPVPIRRINYNIPTVCMHCSEPPCLDVCPVQAISKDDNTGIVSSDSNRCIGCRMCTIVCPLGAISINPNTQKTIKCDLCGAEPSCEKVCGYGALTFVSVFDDALNKRKKGMEKIFKTIQLYL